MALFGIFSLVRQIKQMAILCLQCNLLNITIYCNYSSLQKLKIVENLYCFILSKSREKHADQEQAFLEKIDVREQQQIDFFHRKKRYYDYAIVLWPEAMVFMNVSYKHKDFLFTRH